jgi:hypothetical protein
MIVALVGLLLWLPPCIMLGVAAVRETLGISDRINVRLGLWAAGWFGTLLVFATVANVIRNLGGF